MKYIVSLLLLVLCLFALPYLLSTRLAAPLVAGMISKKMGVPIKVGEVRLRWLGPQKLTEVQFPEGFSLHEVQTEASLFALFVSAPSKFRGSGGAFAGDPTTTLERIEVEKKGNESKIFGTTQSQGKRGSFRIEGNGAWKISLDGIPSRLVESYFPKLPLVLIAGPLFSGDISLTEDKEMRCVLSSPTFRLSTKGRVDRNLFYPTEESYLIGALTKEVSQQLFQKSSLQPVSANHIELKIFPEGARIALAWEEIQIPKAELALNKVIFHNFGALSDLLSAIALRMRPNQDVMIWFQKFSLSFYQGVIKLEERAEMLLDNNYELGLWGSVDLKKQRAHLTIGLTRDVLIKLFGLSSVPSHYTIPMKLDGPFTDLHLHKSRALKQIAGLVLLQQAQLPLIWPEEKTPAAHPPYPWR